VLNARVGGGTRLGRNLEKPGQEAKREDHHVKPTIGELAVNGRKRPP
jgi:hypothetical protein